MFGKRTQEPGSEPRHGDRHTARGESRRRGARSAFDAVAILESLEPAIIGRGLDGLVRTWNAGAERLYGYSADEMIGLSFTVIVPSEAQAREAQASSALASVGLSDKYETQRRCKDGSEATVNMEISPVRDASGAIVGVSTSEHQAAGRHDTSRWMSSSEGYLRSAFEDAPIGTALVSIEPDSAGRLLRVNRALCELTGYSVGELEMTNVRALVHPDDAATDHAAMLRLYASELEDFQLEQRLLHAERHTIWTAVSASLVRDAEGEPLYCIRQVQDIDERKRYEGELGYLVEHDPLTGLLNRRGFIRELEHELAYARRYGGNGSVLFLDLDDLKYVNDTRGHDVGDEVLSEIARIVTERLRETDSFARLGGDEFAVLLPHTTSSQATLLSESLLDGVRAGCSVELGEGRAISMSVGVNPFNGRDEQTAEAILVNADDAMYLAKEAGKNRVAIASALTRERTQERVTWADRVSGAVRNSLFELYCQPIVDFTSDTISQWELLLRLPGSGGELILPAQFLYTVERSGLMLEIDRWVVDSAITLIGEHRDAGRDVRLEVNISGRSVGDDDLLALIRRRLEESTIDPANLVLEVTETAAIANMDRARGFATTLQELGCGFALDDFGAGFGSFYYLKHIPFDYVKIDGEFIRNLPHSTTDQLILDSIVQMTKGLGKHTIAEFVGDSETVEVLKQHGVDYGQGFHLGRPKPVADALPV